MKLYLMNIVLFLYLIRAVIARLVKHGGSTILLGAVTIEYMNKAIISILKFTTSFFMKILYLKQ